MNRIALLAIALLLVLGSQTAHATTTAEDVHFACHGIIYVNAPAASGTVVNPACAGPLEVVATVNAPVYQNVWVKSVRVFHNVGRINVHLDKRLLSGFVRVAYLGFRPGP